MDVIAAYQQVGTYRGAAVMCGTTHKTVKRIIERAEGGGKSPDRAGRGHNEVFSPKATQSHGEKSGIRADTRT